MPQDPNPNLQSGGGVSPESNNISELFDNFIVIDGEKFYAILIRSRDRMQAVRCMEHDSLRQSDMLAVNEIVKLYYDHNVYFDTSYDLLSEGKKSIDFSDVLKNEKSYSKKVIEFIKKSVYHKSLDDKYKNSFTRAAFVDGQDVDAIDLVSVHRIIVGQGAQRRLEQVLSVNKLVDQINSQVGDAKKVFGDLVEYKQVGGGKTAYIIPAIVIKFL